MAGSTTLYFNGSDDYVKLWVLYTYAR